MFFSLPLITFLRPRLVPIDRTPIIPRCWASLNSSSPMRQSAQTSAGSRCLCCRSRQVDPGSTPSVKHTAASAIYKNVIFSEQNERKRCTEHIRKQKNRNKPMIRSHDGDNFQASKVYFAQKMPNTDRFTLISDIRNRGSYQNWIYMNTKLL